MAVGHTFPTMDADQVAKQGKPESHGNIVKSHTSKDKNKKSHEYYRKQLI